MQQAMGGMFVLALVLAAVCGYLLGSISSAVLVSRMLYGSDVREKGSGNAGMTNVLRSYGKLGGVLTLVGDALKGLVAVFLGRLFMVWLAPGIDVLYGAYIAGITTIVGHIFPLYFGFKGGKGIATSLGVILALQPVLAGVLLAIFLIIVAISRMVSLGSVIAISLYPVATLLWCHFVSGRDVVYSTICAAVIALMIVWMHRDNLRRIANGTEYKFGEKKNEAQNAGSDDHSAA